MSAEDHNLGPVFKRMRNTLGMTQREMAGKLGVDDSWISHLEKGRRDPSLRLLRKLTALGGPDMQFMLVLFMALMLPLPDRKRLIRHLEQEI